jgi:hypothetical protein
MPSAFCHQHDADCNADQRAASDGEGPRFVFSHRGGLRASRWQGCGRSAHGRRTSEAMPDEQQERDAAGLVVGPARGRTARRR